MLTLEEKAGLIVMVSPVSAFFPLCQIPEYSLSISGIFEAFVCVIPCHSTVSLCRRVYLASASLRIITGLRRSTGSA